MLRFAIFHCFVIFINSLLSVDAARILAVFPIPSISHQVVFRPITQELARRGHELVIITTDPAFPKGQAPKNIREIDLHDLSYEVWAELFVKKVTGKANNLDLMASMLNTFGELFEMQINTEEVQELLDSKQHFDLVFSEALVRTSLVMSYVFKAPVIQISSLGPIHPNLVYTGSPTHPLLYPELFRHKTINLTIWDKIYGIYQQVRLSYTQWRLETVENNMLKTNFGPLTPTISDLNSNVDMHFFNIDSIWESNRPQPPGVILMGGLPNKPPKPLPGDLVKYLDESKHGVIYMSFGTNVDPAHLPPEVIQIFKKVFSKLPYNVLWKWSGDEMPGRPDNVRISKWFPQSDVLRHPNIKLFITQGGLQSTDEALNAGVPLIAFPLLGDQWFNADKYVHHKIGLRFELVEINEDLLEKAIKQVIEDESYRRNAKQLGKLMRDKPDSSLERAVWWTEYVIRHGGAKHLRPPSANMSWPEYFMLDVVWTLIVLVAALLAIVTYVVKYLCSRLSQSMKMKKD